MNWKQVNEKLELEGIKFELRNQDIRIDLLSVDLLFDGGDLKVLQRIQRRHPNYLAYFQLRNLEEYLVEMVSEIEGAVTNEFSRYFTPNFQNEIQELEEESKRLIDTLNRSPGFNPTEKMEKLPEHFARMHGVVAIFAEKARKIALAKRFPNRRDGFVYLFKLETGHYKIGFSNDPERRSRQISSGLPFSIEILHTIETNQMECLETELHDRFERVRYGTTEWFNLSPEDVASIQSIEKMDYEWIDNPEWEQYVNPPRPRHPLPSKVAVRPLMPPGINTRKSDD